MQKIEIGKIVKQPGGFEAIIPNKFPQEAMFKLSPSLAVKLDRATRLVGKLDGITHTLPDVDFFLSMFVLKDATSSAQIEGTKATIIDAIEKGGGVNVDDTDADDILHYTQALNYGAERIKTFPISLRLIREIHRELMTDARATHFADPGEFRKSQNWIGGTTPSNASFIPPPVVAMHSALNDLESFLHPKNPVLPLLQAALMHAQFETIHPFLDGNGRTGRLLITMLLYNRALLERPVLFLSSFFKKHQKVYYSRLHDYHYGNVEMWIDFFMDGVIETANQSVAICKEITELRDRDMAKIQSLARRESESGVLVLEKLYSQPIISSKNIMGWTNFTRGGALRLIERFVTLGILEAKDENEIYDRTYIYRRYVEIFEKEHDKVSEEGRNE